MKKHVEVVMEEGILFKPKVQDILLALEEKPLSHTELHIKTGISKNTIDKYTPELVFSGLIKIYRLKTPSPPKIHELTEKG